MKKLEESFKVKNLSKSYQVKNLKKTDISLVLKLCKSNPCYYKHCPPNPTIETIQKDMDSLPPNTSKKDKFYIGLFNRDELVAIMDLILKYPNKDTCFIGLFMMDEKYQKQGIGSQIIQEVLGYLKKFYKIARLGYVSTNEQSKNFWLKNGFTENGQEHQQPQYLLKVMTKDLI